MLVKLLESDGWKLNALARLKSYMELIKNRIQINAFFLNSQFIYYLTMWMFHSCSLNNKINRLHKRCFRII